MFRLLLFGVHFYITLYRSEQKNHELVRICSNFTKKAGMTVKDPEYFIRDRFPEVRQRNLILATILNFFIFIGEIIGGVISNSLALISDAAHNISDAFAVAIALVAYRIGKRDPDLKRTFGFRRIEILAAFFNAVILIVIIIFLFYEAVKRLEAPQHVRGPVMLIVASAGFIANMIAVLLLRQDKRHNLNVKSAYIHLLGDSLASVAVIVGSVVIIRFKIYWIDPALTILVGIFILRQAYKIIRQAVDILMQSTPERLDLMEVKKEIEKIDTVSNIHHVHAWTLDDRQLHFECHIDLKQNYKLSELEPVRKQIEKMLHERFNISHLTIQFEFDVCHDKEMIHHP